MSNREQFEAMAKMLTNLSEGLIIETKRDNALKTLTHIESLVQTMKEQVNE